MENYEYPKSSDFSVVIRWGLFGIAVLFILGLVMHIAGVFSTVATAPGRVVNKTLGTDNIIASYEWFFDANAQFNSRLGQIKGHANLVAIESEAKEKSRLNIELAAMRQSCRDLATRYNANSEKVNKSIFRSNSLPEALEMRHCEASL